MDLLDYWFENPPLHLMVKSYLGFDPKTEEEARPMTPEEIQAWVASINRR